MFRLYRRSNVRYLVCAVLLSFFFSAISDLAFAQGNLRISLLPDLTVTSSANDSYFVYNSPAGTVVEDTVLVINSENIPLDLDLYAADVNTASSGGAAFSTNLGEDPTRTGAWLNLSETRVTLEPDESRAVPFTFTIPPSATAGEYAAAIVAQRADSSETKQDSGLGINLVPRVAITMWATIPGSIEPQLAITSLTAGQSRTRQVVVANLHNSGNVGLKPQGSLIIREQGSSTPVYQAPIQMGYFLAGDLLDYHINLKEPLPAGEYEAILSLTHRSGTVEWTESLFLSEIEEARPLPVTDENETKIGVLETKDDPFPISWIIAAAVGSGFIILLTALVIILFMRLNRPERGNL
jgi:hypothetical protein